jgi:hypothetical protein
VLAAAGIRISMDGRGRWIDNVFIERLWCSLRRITVDWDTSQADDFRTRGVPWSIK